jgi:hypothetical protein
MSFDWSEYIDLAHDLRLSANGREAYLRSAISRAYYGVFILARNHLRDKDNVKGIPQIDAHNFVILRFQNSRNQTRQTLLEICVI